MIKVIFRPRLEALWRCGASAHLVWLQLWILVAEDVFAGPACRLLVRDTLKKLRALQQPRYMASSSVRLQLLTTPSPRKTWIIQSSHIGRARPSRHPGRVSWAGLTRNRRRLGLAARNKANICGRWCEAKGAGAAGAECPMPTWQLATTVS